MKTRYFKEDDVMDFYWGKKKEVESSMELKNINILIDLNKEGRIIGIEIYDFAEAFKKSAKEIKEIFELANKKQK